jgi:putative toxin-antitoxin system antitoxin component (TIGR02293 family)
VRYQRLLEKADDVFGDAASAREWLTHKQPGLGGAVPLDFARTEIGAREVENLLGRIEYGVYS